MSRERHEFIPRHEPEDERRSDERITSVYRPVLIEMEEFAGFCLVRNLSAGGMMGSVYADFAEHQPVTVQFNGDHIVSGTISWSREGRIGIKFDAPINVEETLCQLSNQYLGDKVNRSPRLQIECKGEIEYVGMMIVPMRLRDISQRGMKAEVSFIRPGYEVVVHLEGLEPRKAIVRWTQLGLAGLNFLRPIPFEQLAIWAIARQTT